jgi:membrane protein DedA with SNARE-associated domain
VHLVHFLSQDAVSHVIGEYGYGAVAGVVALESMGLPLPGETTLIAAAVVAGTTHALNIWLVIAAAAGGAIIGDNMGYAVGRWLGFWLLVHYGRYIWLTEPRIKLGQYLFVCHGGKVVFFGRFVAVLRALAAFLAGADRMHWFRFLMFNAAGGIAWAVIYGLSADYLGKEVSRLAEPAAIVIGVGAVIILILFAIFIRRHEADLEARAEQALPGPIAQRRSGIR